MYIYIYLRRVLFLCLCWVARSSCCYGLQPSSRSPFQRSCAPITDRFHSRDLVRSGSWPRNLPLLNAIVNAFLGQNSVCPRYGWPRTDVVFSGSAPGPCSSFRSLPLPACPPVFVHFRFARRLPIAFACLHIYTVQIAECSLFCCFVFLLSFSFFL